MKKIFGLFLSVTLTLLATKAVGQISDFYVTPVAQCYSGANTGQAAVSMTVPSASSYTWNVSNGTCNGTVTSVAPNGSLANIAYPSCCGIFTITCIPYQGSTPLTGQIMTHTSVIQCPTFTANFNYMQTPQMGINFTNTTNNPTTSINYRWNFGDNTSSNVFSPSHTYPSTGIYTVTLTDSMMVSPFCASTYTQAVSVCYASFTVPSAVYQGTTTTFNSFATPTNSSSYYYWYSSGLPGAQQGTTVGSAANITFTSLGTQTVTFGFSTSVPSCSVAATQTVNVMDPCTNFTYTQGSNGLVYFVLPSNSSVTGTSYTWTAGSGPTPTLNYSPNGTYTMGLTMQNSVCGTVTPTITVVVNTIPVICNVAANYSVTQGGGGAVNLISTSTGTLPSTTYTWNFGDNTSSVGSPTVAHVYPANGTYVATLSVNNNMTPSCPSSTLKTIVVNSYTVTCNLSAGFTYTQGVNGFINFINTSSGFMAGTTYTWTFGGGQGSSNAMSPSHTYPLNGVYTVSLTVNNNSSPSCQDIEVHTVSVSSNCALAANFTSTSGANGFVNFINTSTGTTGATTYTWNYGDNSTSTVISGSHTYSANGTYTVVLYASNNSVPGCTAATTITIGVSSVPPPCSLVAGFASSNGAGGFVQFQNTSTGTSSTTVYFWSFGDGGTSTLTLPAHSYTTMGPYIATLSVTDGLCSDTFTALVMPCTQSVSFTHTVLPNGVVNFSSTSSGTYSNSIYLWYFGDGQTGTGLTPTHTYSANGTYFDSLVVINNSVQVCNGNVKKDSVHVNSIPGPCTISAAFSHTMGANGLMNFTNLTAGSNTNTAYVWDFGDGFTSTLEHPTHTYNNGGTHYVRLKATNPGCADSTVIAVNITGVSCSANSNFTLTPSGTPKYWNAIPSYPWNVSNAIWTWGDGDSDSTLYTSHLYSVAATYTICLTVTVSCGAMASTCTSSFVNRSSASQVSDIIAVNVIRPDLVVTALNASENEETQYNIFPNPNNGSFDIDLTGLKGSSAGISIYNLVGQRIYRSDKEVHNGELQTTINLEGISNGVFFVTIHSENKSITKKIVVNK